ncbi:hypothetical protein OH77DRAFT_1430638 [Trametes cingulata]|nr:hypothetical protein OH77DRAFT_1430638 [Trametes cingulata]
MHIYPLSIPSATPAYSPLPLSTPAALAFYPSRRLTPPSTVQMRGQAPACAVGPRERPARYALRP